MSIYIPASGLAPFSTVGQTKPLDLIFMKVWIQIWVGTLHLESICNRGLSFPDTVWVRCCEALAVMYSQFGPNTEETRTLGSTLGTE